MLLPRQQGRSTMYSALVLISPAPFSQVIPKDSLPDSKQRRTSHDLSEKPILVSAIPTSCGASSLKSLHLRDGTPIAPSVMAVVS